MGSTDFDNDSRVFQSNVDRRNPPVPLSTKRISTRSLVPAQMMFMFVMHSREVLIIESLVDADTHVERFVLPIHFLNRLKVWRLVIQMIHSELQGAGVIVIMKSQCVPCSNNRTMCKDFSGCQRM